MAVFIEERDPQAKWAMGKTQGKHTMGRFPGHSLVLD